MTFYRRVTKPVFDYFFATLLILILSPLFLILSVFGFFVFKQPLFTQLRIGRYENAFTMIKFRSMSVDADEKSISLWGAFLRKSSLDELPQLINILRGEMSFIGPRPLLPEYLPHYSKRQSKRHLVKPGISGLAQVNGRNALSWKKSLEYDAVYAEKISLKTDLKILIRTCAQLFKFTQVNQTNDMSRESFIKNKQK